MLREVRLFDALDEFAGRGVITHALACTYGYDGDTAYERLWRPLIERYGVRRPLVIADGASVARDIDAPARVDSGTPLAVSVVRPARSGRGVFHPKLLLAVKEDGVLLVVGSANLTKGGLGGNLELVTAFTFVAGQIPAVPKTVLAGALEFLRSHIRVALQSKVDQVELALLDEIVKHAEVAAEAVSDEALNERAAFVHSGAGPIWNEVLARHAGDPLERIVVVSPFYEREDPDNTEADGLFMRALEAPSLWSSAAKSPRIQLYMGTMNEGVTRPPVLALERYPDDVILHAQRFSEEPRRLHGKLVFLVGEKRVSVLWGSANFTPSALLRQWTPTGSDAATSAPSELRGGNAECGILVSLGREEIDVGTIERHYGLDRLFARHDGTLSPPGPVPPPPELPPCDVGELLYDPATGNLSLYAEVLGSAVRRLLLVPAGADGPELAVDVSGPGFVHMAWAARWLEEIDSGTGLRRLRTHDFRVVAFDGEGRELAPVWVRLNVRFDDALEVHENILIGPAALTADGLLVPSSAPPEQRVAALTSFLARLREARASGALGSVRHQASLDVFYRNVRRGLDARWKILDARRTSRFVLLRWSTDLRRALAAATPEALDGPRRAFIVQRTAEHIDRVLDGLQARAEDVAGLQGVLGQIELATALRRIALDDESIQPIVAAVHETRDRVASRLEGWAS